MVDFSLALRGTIKAPQTTVILSGSGSYVPPAGAFYLDVEMKGPGGPGAGSGSGAFGLGTVSVSDTTFGTLTAKKGLAPASQSVGGLGATAGTGGYDNVAGQNGGPAANGYTFARPGVGGGALGGSGAENAAGPAAPVNSGCGGSGAGANGTASAGGGGGQGETVRARILNIEASYAYTVGPASVGGAAGTAGFAGGAGGSGKITVTAHFQ